FTKVGPSASRSATNCSGRLSPCRASSSAWMCRSSRYSPSKTPALRYLKMKARIRAVRIAPPSPACTALWPPVLASGAALLGFIRFSDVDGPRDPRQPIGEGVKAASPAPAHHGGMEQGTSTIWTIGHSTRDWPVFTAMLAEAGIEVLVDVRRFAGSRRNPQFSGETMARELPRAGIGYRPVPELGGRRRPAPDSPNDAWRNSSFRGYADYMMTPQWQAARDGLEALALRHRVAIMCAEALWWQCHRGLISDDLKARG